MKNLIILYCLMFAASVFAQDETSSTNDLKSKEGTPILPVAGDIAVGVDAVPFLNFIGNIFNNSENNTLNINSANLYFRYHLSDNIAIRSIFSIAHNQTINREYVVDDAAIFANPLSNELLEDKQTDISKSYNLNIAFQKSRGYGRLRGIYGVQINYGFARNNTFYQYGNQITVANPSPSTAFFGNTNERNLEIDGGLRQNLGAGILAGVEYYFMPKACIGFEVGLNYNIAWNSQGDKKTERFSGTEVIEIITQNIPSGRTNQGVNTFRPSNYPLVNGGVYLMFHF